MTIYLDYNSTTPLAPEVLQKMNAVAEHFWLNPSCSYGQDARKTIETARQSIADLFGVNAKELIFTSGGTESNFAVLNTFSKPFWNEKPLVISTNIEHPSILSPLRRLSTLGLVDVTLIPVNSRTGVVDVEDVISALKPNRTILVSVMLANNETGAVMPVDDIVRAISDWKQSFAADSNTVRGGVYVHSDIAQAVGKLPVNLRALGVDYATIVGHKFHGPRIGCLFVRGLGGDKSDPFLSNPTSNTDSAPFVPLFLGGGQECGFRSGTENTPMISGLGEAAKLISANLTAYAKHMLQMRQFLEQQLREAFPSTDPNSVCIFGLDRCQAAEANSSPRSDSTSPLRERFPRLPNTVNITFRGPPFLNSRSILALCPNLLASRGAACHSGLENSSVLHAVGYTLKESSSAIRLSVGRYTTKDEILEAVASIRNAVSMLRSTENSTY